MDLLWKKGFTFIDSIVLHIRAVARDIVSDVLLHGYINHLGNFLGEEKENIRENVETKRRQLRAQKNNISWGGG